MVHRIEASQCRTDKREWVMKRRERTRHLIELGGLVQKAGLVELTDDDRAVLLGAFLAVAAKLQSDHHEQALARWRLRGKRAFGDEAET
ncbi:MAG: conjugal transfer protein TraD [Sphingopyxis sp.]|nr:MAG: conjugal transfer protein TraD [Sphingopyxis sp.]